jgi:hypothetical protein
MGMSTFVFGFKPPDEDWKKMKAIWDACVVAGIDPPREVSRFFEDDKPDDAGVCLDLRNTLARCYSKNGYEGHEIALADLPPDVKIIRFVNAW